MRVPALGRTEPPFAPPSRSPVTFLSRSINSTPVNHPARRISLRRASARLTRRGPRTTPPRSSACAASRAGRGYVEPRVLDVGIMVFELIPGSTPKRIQDPSTDRAPGWRGEPSTSDGLSACCPLSPGRDGLMMWNDLHGIRRVRVLGFRTLHAGVEGLEDPCRVRLEEPHVQIVVVE
jgi:hypothetical protein